MSAIMENIIREICWNDTSLQDDWIKKFHKEERTQRRALNRYHRWQANIMDKTEASDYTQAVEEYVRRMAERS